MDAPFWLQQLSGMAKGIPSVGDLRRKSEVTDDETAAATAARSDHWPAGKVDNHP